MEAYARGVRAWWRDEPTEEADAAGRNVAELLIMFRRFMGAKDE